MEQHINDDSTVAAGWDLQSRRISHNMDHIYWNPQALQNHNSNNNIEHYTGDTNNVLNENNNNNESTQSQSDVSTNNNESSQCHSDDVIVVDDDTNGNRLLDNQVISTNPCLSSLVASSNNFRITNHDYTASYVERSAMCSSSDCAAERAYLFAKIQELSSDNHLLESINRETREILIEKDLSLGVAQDARSRAQADFNFEISNMKNKICKLENKRQNLKADKDFYKAMFIALNKDLHCIHAKINELLCNHDGISNQNVNQPQSNSEFISRIKLMLDDALQQKGHSNSAVINDERGTVGIELPRTRLLDQSTPIAMTWPVDMERTDIFNNAPHTIVSEEMMDQEPGQPVEILSIPLCGNADNDGIIYNNQPQLSHPEQVQESDSDNDISIVAEIEKESRPAVSSSSSIFKPPYLFHANCIINHPFPSASGFSCTCGRQFSKQSELDNHIHNHSSASSSSSSSGTRLTHCVICDQNFTSTEKLHQHLKEIHKIIVVEDCKICGKTFKSKTQLIRHEKSMHSTELPESISVPSTSSNLVGQTSNQQQHNFTVLTSTKTVPEQTLSSSSSSSLSSCLQQYTLPDPPPLVPLLLRPVNDSVALLPSVSDRYDMMMSTMGRFVESNSTHAITSFEKANPNTCFYNSITSADNPLFGFNNSIVETNTREDFSHLHRLDDEKSLPGDFLWCICGSKYSTKTSLVNHVRAQTQPAANYICGSCNKQYSSFRKVQKHMATCIKGT